jgi:hypothetical protein
MYVTKVLARRVLAAFETGAPDGAPARSSAPRECGSTTSSDCGLDVARIAQNSSDDGFAFERETRPFEPLVERAMDIDPTSSRRVRAHFGPSMNR